MPRRSFLIASTRSSRSVVSVVVLGLDLAQLFLGAQVDRAQPLALAAQPFQRRLDLGQVRQFIARLDAGKFCDGRRLDLQHVVDFAANVGKPPLGALEALLGAGEFLARGGGCFQSGAGVAVGFRQRVLGLGQAIRAGAPRGFPRSTPRRSRPCVSRRKAAARFPVRRGRAWPRRCAGRAWRSGALRRRGARSSRPCRSRAPPTACRPVPPRARSPAASARTSASLARLAVMSSRTAASLLSILAAGASATTRARPRPWRHSPRRGSRSGVRAPRPARTAAPPGG